MRFVPAAIDLSRLAAPTVIKTIDFEAIRAARVADLAKRLTAAGVDYDATTLESDPGTMLQEVDAYREMLDLQRINEAARAVMLPYAEGPDLDVIGSRFAVQRLAGEQDSAYRYRIALAPEAYASAGSAGAYAYHARSVSAEIVDVGVTSPSVGVAKVVILPRDGLSAATVDALRVAVNMRLQSDEIRPLTDVVVVRVAEIVDYAISAHLVVPAGPDPSLIAASARAALQTLAADCYRVGRSIDASEILGAAWGANVRRVSVTPTAGLTVTSDQAPRCTSIVVTTEVVNG
jgi:phage-related baseplate assembly protein